MFEILDQYKGYRVYPDAGKLELVKDFTSEELEFLQQNLNLVKKLLMAAIKEDRVDATLIIRKKTIARLTLSSDFYSDDLD